MPRTISRQKSAEVVASRSSVSPSSTDKPKSPLEITIAPESRDTVKVNNANLTELKNACDDALKRYLSRPELFNQIYLHTDIRLGFGWASVFVALGTALYGYKVEFEESKPVVWAGLIAYIVLSTLQTLYAYFVEGPVVFVGKRKTFSKRIVSERITISSAIKPVQGEKQPSYELSVGYVRSTNAGKSLLAKGKTVSSSEFTAFFDEQGSMDQERFEQWVGTSVEQAMEGKTS